MAPQNLDSIPQSIYGSQTPDPNAGDSDSSAAPSSIVSGSMGGAYSSPDSPQPYQWTDNLGNSVFNHDTYSVLPNYIGSIAPVKQNKQNNQNQSALLDAPGAPATNNGQPPTGNLSSDFGVPGANGTTPSTTNDSSGITFGAVAKQGLQQIGNISQAISNVSQNNYNAQIKQWQADGKYWMDPKADVSPDINGYLAQMPSQTQADTQGTLTGGYLTAHPIAGDIVTGPLGMLADKIGGKGAGEYIYNKGGQGAAEGASTGGWVGAVVGGAIGVVEGIFGWGQAEAQDAKTKADALATYQRALAQWTYANNKRIQASQEQSQKDALDWREYNDQKAQAKQEAADKTKAANAGKTAVADSNFLKMLRGNLASRLNEMQSRWYA